jgi:hypothetical protein
MEGAAPAAERGSERSEEEAAAIAAEAAAAAAAAVEEEQEEHAEVFDNLMPLCIRFFWLSGLAGLAGWLAGSQLPPISRQRTWLSSGCVCVAAETRGAGEAQAVRC